MAIEAPDILELEQLCDFAASRLAQLEGDQITMDEQPATEWEKGCLTKTQAWLQGLKNADQMDRIMLAVQTLKDEGVLFWSDDAAGLEIEAMITLSTAHIQESTVHWLNGLEHCPVFPKADYGWWMYCGAADGETAIWHLDMPDELQAIIEWCHQNGIVWLCLDRDGMQVDQFSTFDW